MLYYRALLCLLEVRKESVDDCFDHLGSFAGFTVQVELTRLFQYLKSYVALSLLFRVVDY